MLFADDQQNRREIATWTDVVYLYNPPESRIRNLLAEKSANKNLRLLCDTQQFVLCMRHLTEERSSKLKNLFTSVCEWQRTSASLARRISLLC
jgi:hypothetical protein